MCKEPDRLVMWGRRVQEAGVDSLTVGNNSLVEVFLTHTCVTGKREIDTRSAQHAFS